MEFKDKKDILDSEADGVDNHLFAVLYTKDELLSCGVKNNALDFNSSYKKLDEFDKLRYLWRDFGYLSKLYDENKQAFDKPFWEGGISLEEFVRDVRYSSPYIFIKIEECFRQARLGEIFEPLGKQDTLRQGINISRAKSKYGYINNKSVFRVYAIKIDDNCYVVTGGAIKISKKMQEAENTRIELRKIELAFNELLGEDVCDQASFADFILS